MEADALSVNLDRITVYDRRSSHDVRQADAREHCRECSDEQTRHDAHYPSPKKAQSKAPIDYDAVIEIWRRYGKSRLHSRAARINLIVSSSERGPASGCFMSSAGVRKVNDRSTKHEQ